MEEEFNNDNIRNTALNKIQNNLIFQQIAQNQITDLDLVNEYDDDLKGAKLELSKLLAGVRIIDEDQRLIEYGYIMQEFGKAIKNNTSLNRLELCKINSEGVGFVLKGILENSSLQNVSLNFTDIAKNSEAVLSRLITSKANILNFYSVTFNSQPISEFMQQILPQPNIESESVVPEINSIQLAEEDVDALGNADNIN